MAKDFEITGTEQFVDLAKRLNAQGKEGRGLWRELNATMKDAAEPMVKEVQAHITEYLPDRYAKEVKPGLTSRISRSTKGSSIGLKIVATAKGKRKKRHLNVINDGVLRHPVHGDYNTWVNQPVKPGFWSKPMEAARAIPAKHIRRAIQNTIRKLS